MKNQLNSILGWTIAVLAIAFIVLLRILALVIPIAVAVFVGIWIYHHV